VSGARRQASVCVSSPRVEVCAWMVIVAFLIEMIYRPGRPSGGG
jgi:hypothetical protein